MITVPTRAESPDNAASKELRCLSEHRRLAEAALTLGNRLPRHADELLSRFRLAVSCIQIAAEQAFGARQERDAINRWSEVELGEKQIRGATFEALRKGFIDNHEYDELFRVAAAATRARHDETHRLRRRLRQLAVI